MNGWTVQNGRSMYFVGYAGMEYWFERTDDWDAVTFRFARSVEGEPEDYIDPAEIDLPEYVENALSQEGITLRRRADSLTEAMV